MKKPKLAVLPYRHHSKYKFVVDLRAFGRGRKFFETRAEAKAELARQRSLLERHSREAVGLSQREMSDFITAKNKLAEYGETINEAVKHRVDYLERIRRSGVTIAQLCDEVIEAKRRDGMSAAYLADLRKRLGHFSRDFGTRAVASITVEELDNWFRNLPLSPKSRANYRANVGVLFSYAFKRRIIDHNPILHTARPKLVDKPPEIFSVDQLRALLEAAQRVEPTVLPMLAIGAFASETYDNCNCAVNCGCQFNLPSTHGYCQSAFVGNIVEGHFKDTPLAGLNWAALYKWPGEIKEGYGKRQIIIDERADAAQRVALERIISGEECEPLSNLFSVFASTCAEFCETLFLPIGLEANLELRTASVDIPGIMRSSARTIINEFNGEPFHIALARPSGSFEFTYAEIGLGTTSMTGEMEMAFEDSWTHFCVHHFNQDGLVRERSRLAAWLGA